MNGRERLLSTGTISLPDSDEDENVQGEQDEIGGVEDGVGVLQGINGKPTQGGGAVGEVGKESNSSTKDENLNAKDVEATIWEGKWPEEKRQTNPEHTAEMNKLVKKAWELSLQSVNMWFPWPSVVITRLISSDGNVSLSIRWGGQWTLGPRKVFDLGAVTSRGHRGEIRAAVATCVRCIRRHTGAGLGGLKWFHTDSPWQMAGFHGEKHPEQDDPNCPHELEGSSTEEVCRGGWVQQQDDDGAAAVQQVVLNPSGDAADMEVEDEPDDDADDEDVPGDFTEMTSAEEGVNVLVTNWFHEIWGLRQIEKSLDDEWVNTINKPIVISAQEAIKSADHILVQHRDLTRRADAIAKRVARNCGKHWKAMLTDLIVAGRRRLARLRRRVATNRDTFCAFHEVGDDVQML